MTTGWRTGTGSVRGALHGARGAPNEDDARAETRRGTTIVAVADGHGAPQYPRANRGSRLATEAAVEVLAPPTPTIDTVATRVVSRWRELVDEDLADDPPRGIAGQDHRVLYGTTLLAAAATGDRLLVVQIGDGDTLVGDCDDGTVHRPLPDVDHGLPHVTDSLAQHDAAERARVNRIDLIEHGVDVVLLATDGIDAARPGRDWHAELLAEACAALAGTRPDELDATVASWCRGPAERGGDDSTIAVMVRPHVLADGG